MNKTLIIDFDGTITDFKFPEMGEPKEGVREALQDLKDAGFEIVILSCRTGDECSTYLIEKKEQVRAMEAYLKRHNIPYDAVLNKDKPIAMYYIDDRAIEFKDNWGDIAERFKNDQ